jgi:hypothetical protein
MGKLEIAVQGSDDDDAVLHDLYDAFLDDDSLRPIRKGMIPAKPKAGQMGAEDIIQMALNPDLLSALSACVTAWFATRRSKLKLVIQGHGGQATVEFDGVGAVTEKHVRQALDIAEGITHEASE